jgi:mRNA interferase HigB
MNIIAQASLLAYSDKHAETRDPLRQWYRIAKQAKWAMMSDVVAAFPAAKALNGERVRFAICGNAYRLIVAFDFASRTGWIKFIGTHAEYDKVDALTVSRF